MFTSHSLLPQDSHDPQQLLEAIHADGPPDPQQIATAAQAHSRTGDERWLMPWALGLWRLGRHAEALAVTDRAAGPLLANPDFLTLRGMVARQCEGHRETALQAYRHALAIDPQRADAHYNLANLLMAEQPEHAEQHYRQSLALAPGDAKVWHNLGITLNNLDRCAEAIDALKRSLRLQPGVADVWCNLGLAHQGQGRLEPAMAAFRQAIGLDPNHAPSHINMGNALVCCLEPEQALVYLERGQQLADSSANSLWNLALAHLLLGNFAQGWRYYEARFATAAFDAVEPPSAGPQPASLAACPRAGDPPLLVWSEQGMGDAIQFGRYLTLLDAAGIPYEFHSRGPLLTLFAQWFGCGERAVLRRTHKDFSDQRPQIALMSLPLLFGTELATVPAFTPYLRPPSAPPAALTLSPPPGGLSVGLVWATNPDNAVMYRNKSMPLALLLPPLLDLVQLDLIELHSLQVGDDASQLDPWRDHPGLHDWAPRLNDFADTAHVVQQLDLVISVDTAVAHLAGALAKPTWLLLPHNADYRWLRHRVDSPWYPGMRLFRQPSQGDWPGVVAQLQSALDALFLLDLQALAAARLH